MVEVVVPGVEVVELVVPGVEVVELVVPGVEVVGLVVPGEEVVVSALEVASLSIKTVEEMQAASIVVMVIPRLTESGPGIAWWLHNNADPLVVTGVSSKTGMSSSANVSSVESAV